MFYKIYTYNQKCPADELLRMSRGGVYSLDQYLEYEKKLLERSRLPEEGMLHVSLPRSDNRRPESRHESRFDLGGMFDCCC